MADVKALKTTSGKIKQMATTDTIPTNNLGTGTANNTTYLRGDQTWQTVSAGGLSQAQVLNLTALRL